MLALKAVIRLSERLGKALAVNAPGLGDSAEAGLSWQMTARCAAH
jgi:hypothetical protein